MIKKHKIVVAITGASGSIYAKRLLLYLDKLQEQIERVDVVFSSNAKQVWEHEIGDKSFDSLSFKTYGKMDFNAPFASGSAAYTSMIIIPASMGTIGRISNGISDNLINRAADVMLKERAQLIVVARETPFNLIHLRNMTQLTEAGAIVLPASPSFYSRPANINEVVDTVVHRILKIIGLKFDAYTWGES